MDVSLPESKISISLKKFHSDNPEFIAGENNPFYGKRHSDESKERNRQAHLGKKQSKETIAKRVKTIRDKNNGKWHLDGFKHSEESNQKNREAHFGKIPWNKGITWPKEVLVKMSKSKKGQSLTNEHRRNISLGLARAYAEGRRSGDRRRFITGYFYSKKNGKDMYYRSSYELFAYRILEQMKPVSSYVTEPFSISYFNGYDHISQYIPDILVIYDDGFKELIEVKPERDVEKIKNVRKFKAARKYCDKHDMRFSVWTEDQVFKHKLEKFPVSNEIVRTPVILN